MQRADIELAKFAIEHLDGTQTLTAKAGWPHRRDDWAMLLGLSSGYVALLDGEVVGAMCMTLFGEVATVGLLMVNESLRGQGLGNRLMKLALEEAGQRECRLIATSAGLPLYRKLGFVEVETIRVHRGIVASGKASEGVEWATQDDFDKICDIDRDGAGIDRRPLLSAFWDKGRFAVIRESGKIIGYAALLPYGHGEVAGPVVARDAEEARRLLSYLSSHRTDAPLRVDLRAAAGPADWLNSIGLPQTGSLVAMRHGEARTSNTAGAFHTFVLATNQYGFP